MNERKTQRKNKRNLVMNWPTNDDYFTIKTGPKSLLKLNPDFVEITLRVRLKKAIEEEKTVAEIGSQNTGYGRPLKAFVMLPINPLALEKAKSDGILLELNSQSKPVVQVTPSTVVSSTPVTNIIKPTLVAV